MRKFILVGGLMLSGVVSTHAQQGSYPPYRSSGQDTLQDALRDPDPIHRDERLIAGANRRNNRVDTDSGSTPWYFRKSPTFEARLIVVNNSAKRIKAVSWTAMLTDPGTGVLIRAFDVRTKSNIAPGRTKELKKMLPAPRARVVNAAGTHRNPRQVADLKVAVTSVMYEDGSTSKTP